MSSLFNRPPSRTPAPSQGDLSKDVRLASGPDDSISGLCWCPVANHLAVSSWDSKVRIYDISQGTQGTGVALIDFAGPALACDWSKVRTSLPSSLKMLTRHRMARKSSAPVQTRLQNSSTSARTVLQPSRLPSTMPLFDPSSSSIYPTRRLLWLSPVHGTRPSNIGI